MAEVEIAVLSAQCLDRRIPDIETLTVEVAAWEEKRNRTATKVDLRFTAEDARIALKRLSPSELSGRHPTAKEECHGAADRQRDL
jgi:hypothetical protein